MESRGHGSGNTSAVRSRRSDVDILSLVREYGILFAFIFLFVLLSIFSPVFLSSANLLNLLNQAAGVGIIASAVTLVFIAGGFDLSVGAIFAVAVIVAANVANATNPMIGVLAALAVGTLMGGVNGVLSTVGRLNPFVATLATSLIYRGLALVITGGLIVRFTDTSFSSLARTPAFGDVRWPIIIYLGFVVLCWVLLRFTLFGRYVFAVGGNVSAARLSGVPINMVRGATYALAGFAAALGGLLVASRTLTVDAQSGAGIEFQVIAAVLVGGTSVMGGSGSVWGTFLGVLLFAMINNGFNLLGLDPLYNSIFTGAIIILSVGLDAWARKK